MNYYTNFNEHLKEKFGFKVYKVPVSIGATCPNRTNGDIGCIYCDEIASASPVIEKNLSLTEQI
ncbi:MAG: TIGR01212 family radical SAM protein, partial [Candidatus Cloacimonadota bacterium]